MIRPNNSSGVTSTIENIDPGTNQIVKVKGIPEYIRETHPDYAKNVKDWNLLYASIEGETYIKSKKEQYLPYPVALSDTERATPEFEEDYSIYLLGSHYTEFTTQSVEDITAAVFRIDPTIEAPKELDYIQPELLDISKDLTVSTVTYGRSFSLVDYPTETEINTNVQDLYAYVLLYSALDVINWNVSTATGRKILQRVVIQNSQDKYTELVMINNVYNVNVYELDKTSVSTQPEYLNKTLNHIPGMFTGVTSNSIKVDKSPVQGIAQSNIKHYQTYADMISVQTYASHPQLVLSNLPAGFTKKAQDGNISLRLGAQKTLTLEGSEAKASLIEMNGNNLMHYKTLEILEASMTEQGARLRNSNNSVESADALRIKQSTDQTKLGSIVSNVEATMEFLTEELARFMGVNNPNVVIEMNREFQPPQAEMGTLSAISNAELVGTLDEGSTKEYADKHELL